MGADANTGVAMELKVTAGSETETAGATENLRVTVGSEVGMVADMEIGTDSKLRVDTSGNISMAVGAEVGVGSAIMTAGGDVGVDM